jgi:hypothetical protein
VAHLPRAERASDDVHDVVGGHAARLVDEQEPFRRRRPRRARGAPAHRRAGSPRSAPDIRSTVSASPCWEV